MSEATPRWSLYPRVPAELAAAVDDLPSLLVQLLHNRGLVEPDAMRSFLAEPPPRTSDPYLMRGMQGAVERLVLAANGCERVAIYGDLDVDGVTAAALLAETFSALGISFVTHIPTRSDGYGLHSSALTELGKLGIRLIVTADCGINSRVEIDLARDLGLDVIVTDHHAVAGALPNAFAVINPQQPDCGYPFKDLAAVGVAFKLAQSLLGRLPVVDGRSRRSVATRLLDLTTLGTIGDVSPLVGENRALLRHGLPALNRSDRPGLLALMRVAGLKPGSVTARDVGYALAPRLNAVGRLRDGLAAYRLLLSNEAEEATTLASELDQANVERQRLTGEMLEAARAQVRASGEPGKVLVVADAKFHAGIVGLVAGKLAEEYHRPAFVVELGEAECRGSARSVQGFSVVDALAASSDLLTRYGGHTMAAGFTVRTGQLGALERRLGSYAETHLDAAMLRPKLMIDADLDLAAIDQSTYDLVARLAPFGHRNPRPLFLARRAKVISVRAVGRDGKHLRLDLHDGERYHQAVGFGLGEAAHRIADRIDFVYTLERNEWGGRQTIECHLADWRPAD